MNKNNYWIIKIINIFIWIFLYFTLNFIFSFSVNADNIICDSWNINLSWKTVSEICNWGYSTGSIISIDSFTWSFIDYDLWFWWTKNNYNKNINNIDNNFPIWFFDVNRNTKVNNVNPDYTFQVWYLWNINNYLNNNSDINNNFPVWFFDWNRETKLNNVNPDYILPVWFLGSYKEEIVIKKWNNKSVIIKEITYRDFFEEIIRSNSGLNNKEYNFREFEIFINNLLNLLIDWSNIWNNIISETDKNRIKLYIENSDFNSKLSLLLDNLESINKAFLLAKNNSQKLYIINYYLK
jgi:hypothetical protein